CWCLLFFFFSSRRRHTRFSRDWSSDVCSSDLDAGVAGIQLPELREIETRKRLFQLYPDAREMRPPEEIELAIEGIVATLRGGDRSEERRVGEECGARRAAGAHRRKQGRQMDGS